MEKLQVIRRKKTSLRLQTANDLYIQIIVQKMWVDGLIVQSACHHIRHLDCGFMYEELEHWKASANSWLFTRAPMTR